MIGRERDAVREKERWRVREIETEKRNDLQRYIVKGEKRERDTH